MRRLPLKTAATYLLRREWELAPLAGAREDIQSSLYDPARPLTRARADSHIYEKSPSRLLSKGFAKNGGYLLSHGCAVPSARAGLTSLFGMGRGGTPPL